MYNIFLQNTYNVKSVTYAGSGIFCLNTAHPALVPEFSIIELMVVVANLNTICESIFKLFVSMPPCNKPVSRNYLILIEVSLNHRVVNPNCRLLRMAENGVNTAKLS